MKILVTMLVFLNVVPVYALKAAYVDMQKVWANSKEIKVEKKKMEKMLKVSQDALKKKENELKKLQERAKKDAIMATEEAKRAMAEEYQKKMLEFQQMYQNKQKLLSDKDVKAQADFVNKVKKITMKIASKLGYDIVLAKEYTLYVNSKYDITKQVIKAVNK